MDQCWQPGPNGSKKPLSDLFSFHQFIGKRCFVIAGGPSLRGFDFSQIQHEYTLGINKICQVFHPWLLVSWDRVCYNWYQTQLIKSPIVMVDLSNSNFDRVFYVRSASDFGNPIEINRIYIGTHTGYAAINLALALGFNPIYLLGFDYKSDGNGNYHVTDDWGHPTDIDNRLERFRKEIDQYPEYVKDTKIINLNSDSELKSFPFMSIDEVLKIRGKEIK
jgi:hypothetical protein